MEKNNIISDWLDQHGDPEIDQFVQKSLGITEKVIEVNLGIGMNMIFPETTKIIIEVEEGNKEEEE